MHDFVIFDRLNRILESIAMINARSKNVNEAKDLVHQDDGSLLLDSIALRLQVIGEHVKK